MTQESPAVTRSAPLAVFLGLLLVAASPGRSVAQVPATGMKPPTAEVPVYRHSPLFGLGPQTIYKGGWGVEVEGEWLRTKGGEEGEQALHAALHYGLTEDLMINLAVPLVQRKSETALVPGVGQVEQDVTGVGDAVLSAKYRFFQDLFPNGNHQASLFGGVKLPVARTSTEPPLGSGSVDFLAGATVSRETHRYYGWASVLGRVNTEGRGRRRGNELRYNLALGLRPYVPQWTDPDLMFLLELAGVTAERAVTADGAAIANTGGTVLALAPGFWLTYRNWALKGGVKLPFVYNLNGTQPELDFQTIVALEYHFGG